MRRNIPAALLLAASALVCTASTTNLKSRPHRHAVPKQLVTNTKPTQPENKIQVLIGIVEYQKLLDRAKKIEKFDPTKKCDIVRAERPKGQTPAKTTASEYALSCHTLI